MVKVSIRPVHKIKGHMYLLLADYFTKYPIVAEMPPPVTCNNVTREIRNAYSLVGRPDEGTTSEPK
jgi:hypothetical protein